MLAARGYTFGRAEYDPALGWTVTYSSPDGDREIEAFSTAGVRAKIMALPERSS